MKRMQKTKEVVRMQKRSGGEMAVVGTRKTKNAIKANKTVGSKKRRKPNGERKRTRSPRVKRNYKDSMFRMLFTDKKNLLSLYNAINGRITRARRIWRSTRWKMSFIWDTRTTFPS